MNSIIFPILKKHSNKRVAEGQTNYFKHEIKALGLYLPQVRKISKDFIKTNPSEQQVLSEIDFLWKQEYLDSRLAAIFLLEYSKLSDSRKLSIALKFLSFKNLNWALVDCLSGSVLGNLIIENKKNLQKLLPLINGNKWEKRTCIVSLIMPMRRNIVTVPFVLNLVGKNLYSDWEYSQKACGWVLRECYKKNNLLTKKFMIKKKNMPRITFSYASERMTKKEKEALKQKVYS